MSKENINLIRHFLATLSYRANKVISNVPVNYPGLQTGKGVRTPQEILNHISTVLLHTKSYLLNEKEENYPLREWNGEVKLFNDALKELDKIFCRNKKMSMDKLKLLLQGPLSDAMTHIGQLAMLRRLAGSPIPGENFMKADLQAGKLNPTGFENM